MACPAVVRVVVPTGPAVVRVVAQAAPAVVRVATPGPVGPTGPAGPPGSAYVHLQTAAATTWTINHNLGYRPSVELLDAGSREIDGDVYHPTVNQSVVVFTIAVSGTARLT